MYTDSYMNQREFPVLTEILVAANVESGHDSSVDRATSGLPGGVFFNCVEELGEDKSALCPPDALTLAEEPTVFERLLDAAVTTDERRLLRLIDALLDEAWRFETGKALRGELRRLWLLRGLSGRRFYAAFHGLAERRQRA